MYIFKKKLKFMEKYLQIINNYRKEQPKLLVVGSPRSGFTLLISILNQILTTKILKKSIFRQKLDTAISAGSQEIYRSMREFLSKNINLNNLFISPEFIPLLGGPKWLSDTNNNMACVRKYVGIRGRGDFLAVFTMPKYAMDLHSVIHSHNHPDRWLEDNYYDSHIKFASMRNFLDVINSSVFSINALTGDYIDNVLKQNSDKIRNDLALYKLTDLDFIEGLINPLISYIKAFKKVHDRYFIMKWEDLITKPESTITTIAQRAGLKISSAKAKRMWNRMKFKNQTASHRHNFRKGIIGDWKNHLVNEHLEIIKSHGFDDYLSIFGYEKIQYQNRNEYTPFQQKIEKYIKAGKVINEVEDQDLFMFAFNKSNFISNKYDFVTYSKNGIVQIERSSIKDESFFYDFIDAVEKPLKQVNNKIIDIYQRYHNEG